MRRIYARSFVVLSSLALIVGAALPATMQAQSTVETIPVIVPGDTLRVWAPASRLDGAIGTMSRLDISGLVIQGSSEGLAGPPPQVSVALNNIVRAEVLRSKRVSKTRMMKGAVIGAAGGALAGAFLGRFLECGGACDKTGALQPQVGYGLGAGIGAFAGSIIGLAVGASSRPNWLPVTFTVR